MTLTEILEDYAKFGDAPRVGLGASLARTGEHWTLTLSAPGPALPAEFVAQLGRPYGQFEKKFSGEVPGMGLGLATVRLLMRSIGGDIAFASALEPTGLVTTVFLPPASFETPTHHADEPDQL